MIFQRDPSPILSAAYFTFETSVIKIRKTNPTINAILNRINPPNWGST